jgi:hypothetical protein
VTGWGTFGLDNLFGALWLASLGFLGDLVSQGSRQAKGKYSGAALLPQQNLWIEANDQGTYHGTVSYQHLQFETNF